MTLYLMIDEFQYAEDGGQKLKLVYDTVKNKHKNNPKCF